MESRITTFTDAQFGATLVFNFRGVEQALAHANDTRVAFLRGLWVYEEVRSYAMGRGRAVYDNVIFGPACFTIPDALRHAYRGRTKVLDKVGGYLDRTIPSPRVKIEEVDKPSAIDVGHLIEAGTRNYVQSRRLRDGAEKDAREYFSHLSDILMADPIVMACHDALSYSQLLIYAKWLEMPLKERPRLIVCSDDSGKWVDSQRAITRTPLSIDEVKIAIGKSLQASSEQVDAYHRIWKSTHRRDQSSKHIPSFDAVSFFRVAEGLHAETPASQDVAEQIPTFISAPVMFAEASGAIGLDKTAQQGADPMHVRGGARALKHQAQELASVGLDNAIPRCTLALSRISNILERLETASPTEQADVIELGVEINSLGRRTIDAQHCLGEYATKEVIGFLSEANSFIGRFDTWISYQQSSNTNTADETTAAAALLILESALKSGLLTSEARHRVADSFVTSPDLDDPSSREGVARTTDSLAAVVGRRAIQSVRQAGSELEKEGTRRAVDFSLDFVASNSANLLTFAASRAPWLGLVLRFLSQSN